MRTKMRLDTVATLVISLGMGLLTACISKGRTAEGNSLALNSECAGFPGPVRFKSDSIPRDRGCSLVYGAIIALRGASPNSTPFIPADTARVSAATVDAIAQIDSIGHPIAAWWIVTLRLDGKPYDAEVRLDQKTGERTLRPVHK